MLADDTGILTKNFHKRKLNKSYLQAIKQRQRRKTQELKILGRQFLETDFAGGVTGGHQVVVVQYLQERLDLGLLLQLGLAHRLGYLAWVSVDTSDESMTEWLIGSAIINGLDNDGLAAGVTSTKDNYDFILFHNLPHLDGYCGRGGD
ncbi:hypothetical protein DOY81_000901 [Sarcophaga bullata]|nr:hypothetical protein DOY81_000901 [Sarcophaga bullata]